MCKHLTPHSTYIRESVIDLALSTNANRAAVTYKVTYPTVVRWLAQFAAAEHEISEYLARRSLSPTSLVSVNA